METKSGEDGSGRRRRHMEESSRRWREVGGEGVELQPDVVDDDER